MAGQEPAVVGERGPKGSVWAEGESWKTGSSKRDERIEAYIEWILTPASERVPETKQDLADLLGCTTQTLRNYARDPYVQRELTQRGRSINKVERAGDVLDSLFRQATDPDKPSVQAAKVWLDYVSKTAQEVDGRPLSEWTDEELASAAMKLIDFATVNE